MEDSQERWRDAQQHRNPTDTYFYPHEVRNLVRRQKIIETAISFLLIAAYGIIIVVTGLSLYFFYDAQSAYNHQNSGFFSGFCARYSGESMYICLLVYVFQILVAIGASILLLCSLVKCCLGVW